MHEPSTGDDRTTTSPDKEYSDPGDLAYLHNSEVSRLAYQHCDGTPEDYCRLLFEFAEQLGSLRHTIDEFCHEHSLDPVDVVERIERAQHAERHLPAERRSGERETADLRTVETRDLVRHLFFHSLEPSAIAAAAGYDEGAIRRFLTRANYSEHATEVVGVYHRTGGNVSEVARQVGLSRTRIYQILEAAGIQHGNLTPAETKRKVKRLYKEGHEVRAIMDATGLTKSRVQSVLRRAAAKGELTYPRKRARS